MKKCSISTCTILPEDLQFNKNKSKKDGLNNICKVCSKERSKLYYKNNPEKHKKNVAKRNSAYRIELRKIICEYLSNKSCIDCGNSDIRVLDFDHLRDKQFNISDMIAKSYSWNRIIEEIHKCEIVCSNCHRIRTSERGNFYKTEGWRNGQA